MRITSPTFIRLTYFVILIPAFLSIYALYAKGFWISYANVPTSQALSEVWDGTLLALRWVSHGGVSAVEIKSLTYADSLFVVWPVCFIFLFAIFFSAPTWRSTAGFLRQGQYREGFCASLIFLGIWYFAASEISKNDYDRFFIASCCWFPAFFLVYLFTRGSDGNLFVKIFQFAFSATVRSAALSIAFLLLLGLLVTTFGYVTSAPVMTLFDRTGEAQVALAFRGPGPQIARFLRECAEFLPSLWWVATVDGFILFQFLIVPSLAYGLTYRKFHDD